MTIEFPVKVDSSNLISTKIAHGLLKKLKHGEIKYMEIDHGFNDSVLKMYYENEKLKVVTNINPFGEGFTYKQMHQAINNIIIFAIYANGKQMYLDKKYANEDYNG